MKRFFDIVVSAIGLLLLSPVLAISAIAVKLTSVGPVLFRQERVGKNFQNFNILKFRTMVVGAERKGPQITVGADNRITKVGAVLRKLKFDELPQLWNVFVGHMSFVGPRPEVPKYVAMFRKDYEEVLSVRPGITDIASLKYSNESEVLSRYEDPADAYVRHVLPDKIRLAKEYVQRSSLIYDIQLITKTVLKLVHVNMQKAEAS